MGQFEPAKNLLMKVREIAFIGKGKKPANKKTAFLFKAEGTDETEARIRAHLQEENMELNEKQVGEIAAKVVELIKAAPPEVKPAKAPDETAKADPKAAPVGHDVSAMRDHINALKAAMPVASGGDEANEMTEDEAIAQMENALKLFEQAHSVVQKCYGTKMNKAETLKPATAEEKAVKPAGDAPASGIEHASEADFELSDAELEEVKKCAIKEAGLDEVAT